MTVHPLRMAWVLTACCLASGSPQAAPIGSKGSVVVMGDFNRNSRELLAHYAITARDAVGTSALRLRSDDGLQVRDAAELVYTRLVQRWNLPDAQANVWFIGGVGGIRGNDFDGTRTLVTPGLQFDYETTRVYASVMGRLLRAEDIRHDSVTARAGFSFYEADYDEVQPWFIVEVRRMRGLSDKNELTPMLRLIANRYFVELGYNAESKLRVNFRYTF
jgi:hypothetical protein